MYNIRKGIAWLFIIVCAFIISACQDKIIGENPYDGGVPPLGIKFEHLNRKLDAARIGDSVVISIRGLASQPNENIKVFVNEQQASLLGKSDSTMTIKLPEKVTSGIVKLLVGNQVFFGPRLAIEGKTKVDIYFEVGNGFNGTVYKIYPIDNNYLIAGYFTNYKNEAEANKTYRNSIHFINQSGHSQNKGIGRGIESGSVSDIKRLYDGRLIIAGNFGNFNRRTTGGVAIINTNGELQTKVVDVINADPNNGANSRDTVSVFNGQMIGGVNNVYPLKDSSSVIVVGNFNYHSSINYKFSSKFSRVFNYTPVKSVAKLNLEGKIDSAYQYNNQGINGYISSSAQLSNGKIIIVGAFTQYNNQSARNILVLNSDGTIDRSFAGSGANGWIESVHYNPNTKKIGLAGRFSEYNGNVVNGAVILNEDGTVDNNFIFKNTEGRAPSFIHLMDNGKVFISGYFNKYDGIIRNPFLILESNGDALQDYNHLGGFSGLVYDVIETKSSEGFPALLIGGVFNTLEGINAGSVLRLEIKN